MDLSNSINRVIVSINSNKSISKSDDKNKWKLTDSIKEKITELAKKDAENNIYMGNVFMNLRKAEVAKVAPNRAALIGKFNQSMRLNIRERELVLRFIYIIKEGKKFLHILKE